MHDLANVLAKDVFEIPVTMARKGLYRIDFSPAQLKVFDGRASAAQHAQTDAADGRLPDPSNPPGGPRQTTVQNPPAAPPSIVGDTGCRLEESLYRQVSAYYYAFQLFFP